MKHKPADATGGQKTLLSPGRRKRWLAAEEEKETEVLCPYKRGRNLLVYKMYTDTKERSAAGKRQESYSSVSFPITVPLVQPSWKIVWRCFKKLKTELPKGSRKPTFGYTYEGNKITI